MSRRRTRNLGLGAVVAGALVVPLFATAWAWACVALATVELNPGTGAPGTSIEGKTSGFSSDPTYSDVEVRWASATGPLVAKFKPGPVGSSSFKFTVPQAAPGTYAVIATQRDESGNPAWGTPARATFTVPGAAVGSAPTEQAPAQETIKIKQQHVVVPGAAASAAPAQPVSLEQHDAITTKVAPESARTATYVPLPSRAASHREPGRAGLALVAIGVMAMLSSAAAVVVVKSISQSPTYR